MDSLSNKGDFFYTTNASKCKYFVFKNILIRAGWRKELQYCMQCKPLFKILVFAFLVSMFTEQMKQ